jgi:hypothetical protein
MIKRPAFRRLAYAGYERSLDELEALQKHDAATSSMNSDHNFIYILQRLFSRHPKFLQGCKDFQRTL